MSGIILTGASTPLEVRARILAVCGALAVAQPTILKTVLFDSAAALTAAGSPASGQVITECALSASFLPALVAVTVGGSEPVITATGQRGITRQYQLLVLFYQLCDDSKAEQIAALSVLWSKMDELPDYFAQSRSTDRLRFNDSGLKGVQEVGHMADDGTAPSAIIWDGESYSAMTYTLPVTTSRR